MTSSNTLLEPIAVIGIACEFAGDIYYANDLWYTLKESQDAGSATTIDRFDLKSFTVHMINMDNNGQLHQKNFFVLVILCQINNEINLNQIFLVLSDAEPANIDPCHTSLISKFVHLLDGDGYSVEKMSDTKTSVHIGQFSTDHVIAAARMRPEHRIKILWT
ncbi:unnamed protein product [Adineta steineri]|uniref:Beta-ketoacyl synthase-like N-terminal domain-containing protein n=1 Tax=Adineta steineri TaxID=433720 RepID=A0A819PEB8_9BILA|nr:unnamed protein product [Adineta steineri]